MKIFLIGGVAVGAEEPGFSEHREQVKLVAELLGRQIARAGHDLLVCSPFADSCDYFAARAAAEQIADKQGPKIELHHPNAPDVVREAETLAALLSHTVTRFGHPVPTADGKLSMDHAWLLAQIAAMDRSHAIIALGGRHERSASLLLYLAEARRKPLLPLRLVGGAAALAFERRQYELRDRLGDDVSLLNDLSRLTQLMPLVEKLTENAVARVAANKPRSFFISYSRSRPSEADLIETSLRRRNLTVMRDENDVEPGRSLPTEIAERIHRSDVFIAVWCQEYACSPWCYDELQLALELHEKGTLKLWILCVDNTRIVPPAARQLLSYPVSSRQELGGKLSELLERS